MGTEKPNISPTLGPEENPPAYADRHEGPSNPSAVLQGTSQLEGATSTNPTFQPVGIQRVNGYWLYSKHDRVSGTYIVDTSYPKCCIGDCHVKTQMPSDERNKMFFKEEKTIPHASFHTRNGSIKLNLSIEGCPKKKCYISCRTIYGRIILQMPSLQPSKHFLIEAVADVGSGEIVILLPPTFDGLVQIRARYGSITMLPEFAKYAKVLQGSDGESLVRFTRTDLKLNAISTEEALLSEDLDHCLVGSSHGSITLGIHGCDHWEEPPPFSFQDTMQKFKSLFGGS